MVALCSVSQERSGNTRCVHFHWIIILMFSLLIQTTEPVPAM